MLLWLTQWLATDVRAFSVFSYITFRAVLATMTALVIAIVLGPGVIARLQAMKIGQAVRTDGPQTHLSKKGTPTMGGALVLLSITITTLLWADLSNRFVWVVLLVTIRSAFAGRFISRPLCTQARNSGQIACVDDAGTANASHVAATNPISDCQKSFSLADIPFGLRWTTFR